MGNSPAVPEAPPLQSAGPTQLVSQAKAGSFFGEHFLGAKIGKGGFAQVRKLKDGMAVKILDLRSKRSGRLQEDEMYRRDAKAEAKVWGKLGAHPNLVALKSSYFEFGICFLVMEFCDQSFRSFLRASEVTERTLGRVFSQLFEGLSYMHSRNVVHLDIKPDNVLLKKGVFKLADFGLAHQLPTEGLSGVFGTAPFMSPEMLGKGRYRSETDVWSMGVMLYALVFGCFPYTPEIETPAGMKDAIRTGQDPSFAASSKAAAALPPCPTADSLLRLVLNRDQEARITAEQALKHEFLSEAFWASDANDVSLDENVKLAIRAGAFEGSRMHRRDPLDTLLQSLHCHHTGVVLDGVHKKPEHESDDSTASGGSTRNSHTFSCSDAVSLSAM